MAYNPDIPEVYGVHNWREQDKSDRLTTTVPSPGHIVFKADSFDRQAPRVEAVEQVTDDDLMPLWEQAIANENWDLTADYARQAEERSQTPDQEQV